MRIWPRRLLCHGGETEGVKIGSHVSVEAADAIFYFSHMGFADLARLFWRRAGARGERLASIGKSVVKGMWNKVGRQVVAGPRFEQAKLWPTTHQACYQPVLLVTQLEAQPMPLVH